MANRPVGISEENPLFKGVVWFVAAGGALTLGIMVAVTFTAHEPPTKLQESLFEICRNAFTLAFGTIVGLAGGKVARHEYLASEMPKANGPTTKRGAKRNKGAT